jgi:hypothetical protein
MLASGKDVLQFAGEVDPESVSCVTASMRPAWRLACQTCTAGDIHTVPVPGSSTTWRQFSMLAVHIHAALCCCA